MKYIKQTFYCATPAIMLALCLFCNVFTQIALAADITLNLKYTVENAEAYYVITKGETPSTLQVISEGQVVSGQLSQVTFNDSEKIRIIYFVKPAEGYLLTGAGTTGKGNISAIHELKDPSKFNRTEAHVPQEVIERLENEGYKLAWGYTRHTGNRSHLDDRVDGYRPKVETTITHNASNIEVGQTLTMNIVVKPQRPFRNNQDNRTYETSIPDGATKVTIDGNKIITVTDLTKENNNEYRGTVSYVITEDDVKVNNHTVVVNSRVDYTLDLSVNTGDYQGARTRTTTRVDATPGTATFNLVSSPARKLEYDLGYVGAPSIPSEIHNSGNNVNVNAGVYTRIGYEFVGWSYKDSVGNTVILQPSDTFSMPDRVSGTKLVALWKTGLTVYNNNGESVLQDSAIVGQPISLVRPVKEGYVFLCWKDSDGNTYGADETVIMPDKRFTLFALWRSLSEGNASVFPDEDDSNDGNVTDTDIKLATGSSIKTTTESSIKTVTDSGVKPVTDSSIKKATGKKNKSATGSKSKTSTGSKNESGNGSKGKQAESSSDKQAAGSNSKRVADYSDKIIGKSRKWSNNGLIEELNIDPSANPAAGVNIEPNTALSKKNSAVCGTLPRTGGTTDISFWLGLSILSGLFVYSISNYRRESSK